MRVKFNYFKKATCAAFSLTEVMVGVLVAGGVMAAVYAGVASGFQTMQLTRENLRATQILVERLEAIRGSSWQNLASSPPPDFTTTQYTPVNGKGSGVTFYGSFKIESPDDVIDFTQGGGTVPTYANVNALKAITITLTWTNVHTHLSAEEKGSSGKMFLARTRSMTTFVSEHGLQSYVIR